MVERCSSCDQMKKENAVMRKAMMETSKNYVEVVNENLSLRRNAVAELMKAVNKRRNDA